MSRRSEKRQARIHKQAERAVAPLRKQAQALLAEGRAEEAVAALLDAVEGMAVQVADLMTPLDRKTERGPIRKAAAAAAAETPEAAGDGAPDTEDTVHDDGVETGTADTTADTAQDSTALTGPATADADAAEDARTKAELEALREEAEKARTRKPRPGRRPLPAWLRREMIDIPVPESERACPCCEADRELIGHDESEVLELVPMEFKVLRYRREKRACRQCGEGGVVTAPPGEKVWEKALPGPNLVSQLVVSKFEDHVPLNRFRTICRRAGVDIADSTLGAWVDRVAAELEPLERVSWQELLQSFVVRTDASGIRVLDQDHENGIVSGTMWCYVGDDRIVHFRYAETGTGDDGPWLNLAGRDGYVQADAANVFDALYDGRKANAREVGCWAHCRRRFWNLLETEPQAEYGIQLIGKMYRIEDLADAQGLDPEGRAKLRREKSRPLLDRIEAWLQKTVRTRNPKSDLVKAANYPLKHWAALTRFLDDGRLHLDNNFCELQIRSLAVGRRNWLFAGSHDGARNSARLYGLLRTAAVNKLDPVEWLSDVLVKLAAGWPMSRVRDLLPQHWGKSETEKRETAEVG